MLYQATAIISCLINIGLKSVKGTNMCIRKRKMKEHCQILSFSLCNVLLCGMVWSIFLTDAENYNTVLFLTIKKKCNRHCNSGNLLDLNSKISTEFHAVRENYTNKTICPKNVLRAVEIQQCFWVCAEIKNLVFELVAYSC